MIKGWNCQRWRENLVTGKVKRMQEQPAKAVYVKDWPSTKKKTQGSSLGCSHDATHRVVTKLQAQNDRAVFDSDDELHRTVVHRDEKDEESGAYMKNDDSDDNKKSVDDGRNFRREDDLSTTTQDCIVATQCALARIYDDPYPCSSNVQRGLAEILNQRFGGSQRDFSDMFVAPTIQLLKRLKTKGFPLMKEGKVIVHLSTPPNNLHPGEFFYQVGRTIPGTLSLKFTLCRSNGVLIQTPATVPEEEFQVAFTKEFLNKGLMDNLLRTILLTSKENSSGVYSTHKVEVNSIMSDYIGRCPSCIPLVKATLLNHTSRRASRNNSNPVYPPNMPAVQGDKTVQLALKALVSNKVPDVFVTYCLQRALKYCQEFTALPFTTQVTGTEYVPIVGPLSRQ